MTIHYPGRWWNLAQDHSWWKVMKGKGDTKSSFPGVLEVNTRDYFSFLPKSKWSEKSITVEDVKVADNYIIQCCFFCWSNLHKTVTLGEMGKEVRRESGASQELAQWVTNPWPEITCNWMLTQHYQDRQAVSFFLIFSWRLKGLFKSKCSEVYYRGKKKKIFRGKPKYPAFHTEVFIVRFENHSTPEAYIQEMLME